MSGLAALTVHAALAKLRAGEITSVELTQTVLSRLELHEAQVQAYLKVTPELALQQATRADALRAAGEELPLLGIPLAVKDNLSTAGVETTAGSRLLQGYTPPFDSTALARLRAAGAVLIGKTNLDEFAMGSSTENSAYFVTHNPWDLERVPGGSSGGSAAAVAAGEALCAIGTDTGGSVRQPAAFCGLVGLRPTYGRISRYGLIAFASSLDQIGPLTRTVADAALLTQIMAGYDPHDSTSSRAPVREYLAQRPVRLTGMRIGINSAAHLAGVVQDAVAQAAQVALETLEGLGAELVEIELPHVKYGLASYQLLAASEASSNLARFDGVRYGQRVAGETLSSMYRRTRTEGFGPEVIRRIMLGTYALSAGYYDDYYRRAQQLRTLIRRDFETAFAEVDLIAGPTAPFTAFRLGEKSAEPLQMYQTDTFTIPPALAGLPALSLPAGFDGAGLPIGLQLVAPAWKEQRLFRTGNAYEAATNWSEQRSPLAMA